MSDQVVASTSYPQPTFKSWLPHLAQYWVGTVAHCSIGALMYGLIMRASDRIGLGTVFTFALGGSAKMPEFVERHQASLVNGVKYDPAHVQAGTMLYVNNCAFCHGVPGVHRGGSIPNLGYSAPDVITNLDRCPSRYLI